MTADSSGLRWLVLGSMGFVGTAVVAELRDRGFNVATMSAPRLLAVAETAGSLVEEAHAAAASAGSAVSAGTAVPAMSAAPSAGAGDEAAAAFVSLRQAFAGVDVVVNAAGLATPGDGESPALTGANALLPAVIALAARAAGVRRLVHLSSASVQGHRRVIDESSDRAPFSAYSRSKALGEEVLERLAGESSASAATGWVTVRATSVQGPNRPTSLSLARVAASPLASVAVPGTAPTPVSSINALAWFVVETGQHEGVVPALVLQPWEGLSVSDVLSAAGGRTPLRLPRWMCHSVLAGGYFVSRLLGERLHGPIRRVELMWFGQAQSPGWAESAGISPAPAVRAVLEQARSARTAQKAR